MCLFKKNLHQNVNFDKWYGALFEDSLENLV